MADEPHARRVATIMPLRMMKGRLEVLLGQNEVINYVKSSDQSIVAASFPGELRFFGGTARREDR